MSNFRASFPIQKFEKLDDGRMLIEGIATDESLDKQGDVMDYEASKRAFAKWAGNLREMHSLKAVGKSLDVVHDDTARAIRVKAFISSGAPDTQAKVEEGVLNAFSIGGPAPRKASFEKRDDGRQLRRVTDYDITELSLVDVGANTNCVLVKADGGTDVLAEEAAAPATEPVAAPAETTPAEAPAEAGADNRFAEALHKALDAREATTTPGAAPAAVEPPAAAQEPAAEPVEDMAEDGLRKADDGGGDSGKMPYGDVPYADPGYQKDGKKRYPIDTPAHIRSAWNYVSKDANAAKYKAGDLKRVKAKIVSAWKKKIDKEGPPSASTEKADAATSGLQKDGAYISAFPCWSCGCMCGAELSDCLCSCCCGEAADMSLAIGALTAVENLIRREKEEIEEGEDETASMEALGRAAQGLKDFLVAESAELAAMGAEVADEGDETAKAARVRAVGILGMVSNAPLLKRLDAAVVALEARAAAPAPVVPEPATLTATPVPAAPDAFTVNDGDQLAKALGSGLKSVEAELSKAISEVRREVGEISETVGKIAKSPAVPMPLRSAEGLLANRLPYAKSEGKSAYLRDLLTAQDNPVIRTFIEQQIRFAEAE